MLRHMAEPADLSPTIIEALYCEALVLADEVRAAFDLSRPADRGERERGSRPHRAVVRGAAHHHADDARARLAAQPARLFRRRAVASSSCAATAACRRPARRPIRPARAARPANSRADRAHASGSMRGSSGSTRPGATASRCTRRRSTACASGSAARSRSCARPPPAPPASAASALVPHALRPSRLEPRARAAHRLGRRFERGDTAPPRPPPASPRRARWSRRSRAARPAGRAMSARSCAIQSLALIPPSILSTRPRRAVGGEGGGEVVGLVRHRLERGAHDLRPAGGEAQPGDQPARLGPPVRRAQPGQRRHDHHPAAVGDRARPALRSRPRCSMKPERIAQPFDQAAGDEHRAFERVGPLAAELVQHGAEQAVRRARQRRAHVGEHEGAGAVGRLGLAGREAALADRRRLLVAGQPADRDRARRTAAVVAEARRRCRPLRAARRAARRTGRTGPRPSSRRPAAAAACGWRCAASVTVRPPVSLHTSQLSTVPNASRPASAAARTCRLVVEQPAHLGGREIGIEQQAGRCAAPRPRAPPRAAAAQKSAVRRSCQTIARASGSPLARSQATTVSRWLVMPIAAIRSAPPAALDHRARAGERRAARSRRRRARPSRAADSAASSSRCADAAQLAIAARTASPGSRWCRRRDQDQLCIGTQSPAVLSACSLRL